MIDGKVLGIDVSDWQDPCNFTAVKKAGYSFVYAKCTEGNNYTADTFKLKMQAADSAGIIFGAYHFMNWAQSAYSQANYFLNTATYCYGDLMPMLDLEGQTGLAPKEAITKVQKWLDIIEEEISRKPAIYLSPSFWSDQLASTDQFNDYPLWLANYGVQSPPNLGEWKPMLWQYTSKATVPGISGNIDADQFFGTQEQLEALKGR